MNKKYYSKSRKRATYKYRKKNIEKIREQDKIRKQKFRLKKRILEARKIEMEESFEKLRPVLYKWSTLFATWDRNFEVDELVNVAFSHGGLRRIKNPKLLSKKCKWIMQDYMRKVRRQGSIDKIIQKYIKDYGGNPLYADEEHRKHNNRMERDNGNDGD